jgi:hypothetical protein
MRRPLVIALAVCLAAALWIWRLHLRYHLQHGELIGAAGYTLVLGSLVLLYFQIKGGMTFERRRTTHDFLHGPVTSTLMPLEKSLRDALG